MTPLSHEFLVSLANAPLLGRVGQAAPGGFDVVLVSSWKEALDRERHSTWETARLAARGELTVFLSNCHEERYQAWNDLVDEIRPQVQAIVDPLCERVESGGKSLAASVRWDCLAACMEYEFADLRPPGFYDRLGQLYLLGRFPCGWQGQYPAGVLEIY